MVEQDTIEAKRAALKELIVQLLEPRQLQGLICAVRARCRVSHEAAGNAVTMAIGDLYMHFIKKSRDFPTNAKAFVLTTALRRIWAELKRVRRNRGEDVLTEVADPGEGDPSTLAELSEDTEWALREVANLPQGQQSVLKEVYLLGLSPREIARGGQEPNVVSARLYRALLALRALGARRHPVLELKGFAEHAATPSRAA